MADDLLLRTLNLCLWFLILANHFNHGELLHLGTKLWWMCFVLT